MLSDEVQVQIQFSEYLYINADKTIGAEHQKSRKEFLAECKKISATLEKILNNGKQLLYKDIAPIARHSAYTTQNIFSRKKF